MSWLSDETPHVVAPSTSMRITAMDMLEPGKFRIAVPFKKRYENFIGGQDDVT